LLIASGALAISLALAPMLAQDDAKGKGAPRAGKAGGAKGKGFAVEEGPPGPVPLLSDGKPDLSGVWNGQRTVTQDMPPMLPWAQKVVEDRQKTQSADDFEARCLPGGPPRAAPYHTSLFSTPRLVLMLFEGNTHMYRQFFVDGSNHPANLKPTFYGDSRAHWDADTLVVDTVGFNDISWMDTLHPHTKQMHLTEKFHRKNYGTIEIDITIEDPGTFTKPWTIKRQASLETKMEMTEYVCNENNQDPTHLDGAH
jgi:hypothetical protein